MKEYLDINEADYEFQIARRLELLLLDGKAVVENATYVYNKTSFDNNTYCSNQYSILIQMPMVHSFSKQSILMQRLVNIQMMATQAQ